MNLWTLSRKNLFRNRVRLALSALGVAVSVIAFATLRTAIRSWDAAATVARRDRLITRQRVTFVMPLPKRYVDDLAAATGADGKPLVERVTFATWFGGRDPARPRSFFASYAIDPTNYLDVYDEAVVPPDELAAFRADRDGALVGDRLAEEMGWKKGDRVRLESPIYPTRDGRPFELVIDGIYTTASRAIDRKLLLLRWDRVDDEVPAARRGMIGWMASRAATPARAAEAATAIDAMFAERETETRTEDERAFNLSFLGMASAVIDVVSVLALVVLVIQALVLANAIGMSARERGREYAALAALGFSKASIAATIVAESAAAAALGGALGGALAWLAIDRGLSRVFERELAFLFPIFHLDASTLVLAIVLAVVTGALAGLAPALAVVRPRPIDALRGAV